ncbi:Hint domain-containing protein [Rhodobacter lacus]|uniref:Hint domain-containing protein n=1 Tax=Rhodobacter lacus TaxID=1641972 RepID=A0ABW5A724_9RHOB
MTPGDLGTFVISWEQTEIDGATGAAPEALTRGATWRWRGEAFCIDGPSAPLLLTGALGAAELRARAARSVRRIVGPARTKPGAAGDVPERALPVLADPGFTLTDGPSAYRVGFLETARGPLLLFSGPIPPRDTDLWVVETTLAPRPVARPSPEPGVICFTPGTLIATPAGARPVEALRPGETVLTRDDGAQPILWIGAQRMSGARLHALPGLCPVRISAGAFGMDCPERDLLVSPHHRMLVKGRAVRALFDAPEVLVRAVDLVDGGAVRGARSVPEVLYIHVMLARHAVLWANGVGCESFHPASANLDGLTHKARAGLLAACPDLAQNPEAYGGFARRVLSAPEAVILRHDRAA